MSVYGTTEERLSLVLNGVASTNEDAAEILLRKDLMAAISAVDALNDGSHTLSHSQSGAIRRLNAYAYSTQEATR